MEFRRPRSSFPCRHPGCNKGDPGMLSKWGSLWCWGSEEMLKEISGGGGFSGVLLLEADINLPVWFRPLQNPHTYGKGVMGGC